MMPLIGLVVTAVPAAHPDSPLLDVTHAVVVAPANLSGPERKAIDMLVDEVEKRTQVRWPVVHAWPDDSTPVVAVGPMAALADFGGPFAARLAQEPARNSPAAKSAEGYSIQTETGRRAATVFVTGNDSRGVLFGVGRLLRTLEMTTGSAKLPGEIKLASAPVYRLRGHQLGYRPKSNTYDGWTRAQFEQYLRDLAVFGTNAIEIIPPRSDDAPTSPLFTLPPMEMMVELSRLADEYGLDLWIWYPAMDHDYTDPRTVAHALAEWGDVFKKLPRIDSVFVPGGDPGHTAPKVLMSFLEKQTANLRRYHPRAQMWVSPQSFNRRWMDDFLSILRDERPAWLTGVVYGPQIRIGLPELRSLVPAQYPIRFYPDITHSLECQFPVPDWDLAYALTEGREVINPRPLGEARIFRLFAAFTMGFITYSEGSNDDVNKMIWSALGWDPNADVTEILREYARYFLGPRHEDEFAHGLLALERNWQGPLAANPEVGATLARFQSMERTASPRDLENWRFQQALYRAYYDAYNQKRLRYESELEQKAMDKLRDARALGSLAAMSEARSILDRARTERVAKDLRVRVFEIAAALFHSIRMQLSVPLYKAESVDRGANLDSIDAPLNSRPWLEHGFAALRKLANEAERLKGIDQIVNWMDPGPGGFYDELGNPARRPHLVTGPGFDSDPDFRRSALTGFGYEGAGPLSWFHDAESLYDAPLEMHYSGLDPEARYKIRIVYAGDSLDRKIRLEAGEHITIHPLMAKPVPPRALEFEIPPKAIDAGELTLRWYGQAGLGGNGRGCQGAEVWLVRDWRKGRN